MGLKKYIAIKALTTSATAFLRNDCQPTGKRFRTTGDNIATPLVMQPISSISLARVQDAAGNAWAQCDVVLDGKNTNIRVPGYPLKAAVQVDETRYVLFIRNDATLGDALLIALIDTHDGLKEVIGLGLRCASGELKDLSVTKESIQFRFIAEGTWALKIYRAPRWQVRLFYRSHFLYRKASLKKYIMVTRAEEEAERRVLLKELVRSFGLLALIFFAAWVMSRYAG